MTRQKIELGLMHRWRVPDGTGMLFVMGSSGVHRFWMKNTLVPLDMIFIDAGYRVVGVVENAAPLDEALRGVDVVSRYVLEVPGGWSARNGVAPGQMATVVRLPG